MPPLCFLVSWSGAQVSPAANVLVLPLFAPAALAQQRL